MVGRQTDGSTTKIGFWTVSQIPFWIIHYFSSRLLIYSDIHHLDLIIPKRKELSPTEQKFKSKDVEA